MTRVVLHRADLSDYPVDFTGEYSPDGGVTFKTLFEVAGNKMGPKDFAVERSFKPVVTDNFRLRISRSSYVQMPNQAQLSEVEVFGSFVKAKPKATNIVRAAALPAPVLTPTASEGLEIQENEKEITFRSKWLRLAIARDRPQITAFSWDNVGYGNVDQNLLKAGETLGGQLTVADSAFSPAAIARPTPVERQGNVVRSTMEFPNGMRARWEMRVEAKSLRMAINWANPAAVVLSDPPALQLAFDIIDVSSVAPIATPPEGDPAPLPLPCLIHSGRNGGILVRGPRADAGFVAGIRHHKLGAPWWEMLLFGPLHPREDSLYVLPRGNSSWDFTLSVETIPMAAPELVAAEGRLWALPRHWLNGLQYRPDCGLLANSIISEPCANCLSYQSNLAVFTPPLPGGLHAMDQVRASLDRWLAGQEGYGNNNATMDGTPVLCISAWDVIFSTGEKARLDRYLPALERLVAGWKSRDVDHNGLYEFQTTGNRGECKGGCNAWDCVNFGHEDAYSLALGYRGLRCLADLERLAGRTRQAETYDYDADRLRAAYVPTFFNPKTGILAGWKSRDGELHDYWFTMINGMAIAFGLVPDDLANQIMDRIMAKMREVGFARFDLGLPWQLVPVAKCDYLAGIPIGAGGSVKEDGSDGFQNFVNGAAQAQSYFFIQALYKLGRRAEADKILWAELGTYAANGFQNGITHGGEMTRWDGKPSGYEGFLAHCYRDPLAVYTGYWGIGFGTKGFYLEPWSPLKGKRVKLGLMYMGQIVPEIQ